MTRELKSSGWKALQRPTEWTPLKQFYFLIIVHLKIPPILSEATKKRQITEFVIVHNTFSIAQNRPEGEKKSLGR